MTQTVLLGDIAADGRSVISGPFGSSISSKYFTKSGVPVIRGNNLSVISGKKFIDSGFVFVSREKANELKAYAHKGDIILTAAGTIGQVGIIPDEATYEDYIISNKQIRVTVDPKKARSLFIYYALSNPIAKKLIESMNTGSTIPLINLGIVKRLPIPNLDLKTQDKIIGVIGSIDEKIELNRKMNETLEQMGQVLFRHYFIDNPEAEKWEDGKFADVSDVLTGKGSTKSQLSENGIIPLYGANGVMGTSEDYLYDEPLVITGRVGTLGKVRAVTSKAWFSDNVLIMKPKVASFGFIYHLAQTFDYISMNRGSTQPLVTQTDLKNKKIRIPDDETLEKFEKQFSNLFEQQQDNEEQIQTLTTLRDTLLPRLINGKVKV